MENIMPGDDEGQSFEDFRNSPEGKQPVSPEFEANPIVDGDKTPEDEQGGSTTPPDGTSTGVEADTTPPSTPSADDTAATTDDEAGTGEGAGQEDGTSSAPSNEEKERQLKALEGEESKVDKQIAEAKARIAEKRAERRGHLDAAKDEGLFQRDDAPTYSGESDLKGQPQDARDPNAPMTRAEYEAEKANDVLSNFLMSDEGKAYREENDPHNENWDKLKQAMSDYREPTDAAGWQRVIHKAHRDVQSQSQPPNNPPPADEAGKKAALEAAGQGGSGGAPPSGSGSASFDQDKYDTYVDHLIKGGHTPKEADKVAKRALGVTS